MEADRFQKDTKNWEDRGRHAYHRTECKRYADLGATSITEDKEDGGLLFDYQDNQAKSQSSGAGFLCRGEKGLFCPAIVSLVQWRGAEGRFCPFVA